MRTLTQPFMALRAHTMFDPASSLSFHVSNMPFQPIKEASCSCFQHVPPNLLEGNPPCFIDVLPSRKLKKNIIYIYIIYKIYIPHWEKKNHLQTDLGRLCFFVVQAEVPSSEFNSSQDSEWHSDTSSAMSSYLRQFQVVETMGQITAGCMRTSWDLKKQFLCEQMSGANLWRYIRYTPWN